MRATASGRLRLPRTIQACLFDLDGVLTRTARVHATAWKEMFDAVLRDRAAQREEQFVPFDPVADYGDYVDGIVAAEHNLRGKPAPETFLAAAKALEVDAGEAAVFEDALAGVAAARAGGLGFVVGVDRVGQSKALREHGADIVVQDLAELLE